MHGLTNNQYLEQFKNPCVELDNVVDVNHEDWGTAVKHFPVEKVWKVVVHVEALQKQPIIITRQRKDGCKPEWCGKMWWSSFGPSALSLLRT